MSNTQKFIVFFAKPALFALTSFLFFWYCINPYLSENLKLHETLIGTYVSNVFVGWIFFSAFLLLRADEEWKKTDEAIREKNKKKFLAEAPKQMAVSVLITHIIVGFLAFTSFYLFYYEFFFLAFVAVFGTSFLIAVTTQVLWDLDNPLEGLIQVQNVPKDWLKRIKE